MSVTTMRLAVDASIEIDGKQYVIPANQAITRKVVPTQPGDGESEFERRIANLGLGWGWSRYETTGTYDYANTANLHRPMAFLPGSTVTDRTTFFGFQDCEGAVSFVEHWSAVASERRLIAIGPRQVSEISPAGTSAGVSLTALFPTVARGMTRGVRYKNSALTVPKIYIARSSDIATDYMVERTAAATYAISPNNKYAAALAAGKDDEGADVLWRIDEHGKLNQSVADTDPSASGSWAGAEYPVGESSVRVNDLAQQNRAVIAGRADGFWTFDTIAQSIPLTSSLEETPDNENARWMKDFNGILLSPHIQGLIYIDGLEWDTCGPVSANDRARSLRGREIVASDEAGRFVYAGVYVGTTTYIFLGTPFAGGQSGSYPFTWHGPIASIDKRATDLKVSTVWGRKLWIGYRNDANTAGGFATIELNEDFSPVPDAPSGEIFLPDGILDMDGPGVIKDLRKVEFVAPSSAPFSATNQWIVSVNPDGAGWNAVDGGPVASGLVADRYFSTERYGKRIGVKLSYSGNAGAAELEQLTIRGSERPETTDLWTFPILAKDGALKPSRNRMQKTAFGVLDDLRLLIDSKRIATTVFGEYDFTARVVGIEDQFARAGQGSPPVGTVMVTVKRIKVSP